MNDARDKEALDGIRRQIDALDEQLQLLISERARLALVVGGTKYPEPAGLSRAPRDYYRPEREAEVLRKALARNSGPLKDEEIIRLFREIMSACLAQQEPLKVAFLGPEGTFSQAAVLKQFGHSVRTLAVPSIEEVFHDVEAGIANFGVVPVENSTEGTVSNTLDMLVTTPLQISGEVELRIRQHLLGRMDSLADVARVYSHQQSLAQCRAWLEQRLPGIEQVAVASNAEAARRAATEEGAAAIAGGTAAEVYGLKQLMANIEDRPDNTTRFVVIGREASGPSGRDKTSLLLSSRHQAGALQELLRPLSEHKVSMTRIESRPSRRGKWDYVFFVDVEGHREDANVAAALRELETAAAWCRVLGSYPVAIL
ncbi:MAG TPA: prephenate dehydratase [Gammaproteobacteria bacterium]|nr:prephenate dehydratase [Gammaproteobacteria bacterium]